MQVATPVNWTSGSKCMVVPSVSDADAKELFGGFEVVSVPSAAERKKEYIRMVPDPAGKAPSRRILAAALTPVALVAVGLVAGFAAAQRCRGNA